MTTPPPDSYPHQPDLLNLQLVECFSDFGPLYARYREGRSLETGVTYARSRLLAALFHSGAQIMNHLSERLGVTPRNVTTLVDALEKEGLLVRKPHPTDRRATIIELTPAGDKIGATVAKRYQLAMSELFDVLSEQEKVLLLSSIKKLETVLDEKLNTTNK